MRITLTEGFQVDARALEEASRGRLFEVLLGLAEAFRAPQRHRGVGLRKLHASGIWEARLGLGLRLVLALEPDEVILVKVGTHDEIRRYLRQL